LYFEVAGETLETGNEGGAAWAGPRSLLRRRRLR
jgi:hypothetical protein